MERVWWRSSFRVKERSSIVERQHYATPRNKAIPMQLQRVAYRDIRIAAQSGKAGGEHREADGDDTRDNKYDGEEENEPHWSTATRLCRRLIRLVWCPWPY